MSKDTMPIYKWSKTAVNNAAADSTINWAEGMAPSAVNDSARAEMAAVAKWRDDISGTLTTGGTSTAYTLTTNSSFDNLANMSGAKICFIPHTTSGASPTLNVDGLGAKAINASTGVAVAIGALVVGTPYLVTYVHASTEFILLGVQGATDPLTAKSTDAGAGVGPVLDLYRDSASPAASDFIGSVDFNGRDSAANKQLYARLVAQITDPTSTSEDAILLLQQCVAGTLTTILQSSASALTTALKLSLTSTDCMAMANGTTAQRNGSPTEGDVRYNSTLHILEYYDGTRWALVQAPTKQYLTSGTAAAYTTPAGCRALIVRLIGGGGGGGAAATNSGSTGGTTIFNSINANGGGGGTNGGTQPRGGGSGGSAGTGSASLRLAGSAGWDGNAIGGGNSIGAGQGAPGLFGMGAGDSGGQGGGDGGNGGTNTGAGGGGGQVGAGNGGGGGGAGEYVEIVISGPASSYTYTVGGGGNGGAAGSQKGGNGGSGLIIVEEYY